MALQKSLVTLPWSEEALHHAAALLEWHDLYAPAILSISPLSSIDDNSASSLTSPPQRNYSFSCFSDAYILWLYWTLMEVYNILRECNDAVAVTDMTCTIPDSFLREPSGQRACLHSRGSKKSMRPSAAAERGKAAALVSAKHICSTYEYAVGNCTDGLYVYHIFGPLNMAIRCFMLNLPASTEYLAWTYDRMHGLVRDDGSIMGALMSDRAVYSVS